MTGVAEKAKDISVGVPPAAHEELKRLQREFIAAHPGATISLGGVVEMLLAGRKPVQP